MKLLVDFGELIVRSGQLHAGVLLLRLDDARSQEKLKVVQKIFAQYRGALSGNYCIYQGGDCACAGCRVHHAFRPSDSP